MTKRMELPNVHDKRYDLHGVIEYYGVVNGYYILCRPGRIPYPASPDMWHALSPQPVGLFDNLDVQMKAA